MRVLACAQGHLNINNLKMSKSLKNFISIRRGKSPVSDPPVLSPLL